MLMCFWRGKSTPAIRAMCALPLPALGCLALALFVFRVDADHPHHTLAVDDLALVTDFLYRCSYFHKSSFQPSALSRQKDHPTEQATFIYSDIQFCRDSNRRVKVPPRPCRRAGCG